MKITIEQLTEENKLLKEKLLNLEIKLYGSSEEEYIRKNKIKEIRWSILKKVYGKLYQDKTIVVNEVCSEHDCNYELVKEAYTSLLKENLIREIGNLTNSFEIVCTTPTGLKDAHHKYVITLKDEQGNLIKNDKGFCEFVCAFCGRK